MRDGRGNGSRFGLSPSRLPINPARAARLGRPGARRVGLIRGDYRTFARVAVTGRSMEPTLREGDWLIAVPLRRPPRAGDLVVVRDPREKGRLIVKRVRATRADGTSDLVGDNPAASTDGRTFGPIGRRAILARVAFRYAPLARSGRVQ